MMNQMNQSGMNPMQMQMMNQMMMNNMNNMNNMNQQAMQNMVNNQNNQTRDDNSTDNSSPNNVQGLNVIFRASGAQANNQPPVMVQCMPSDTIQDIIDKYRNKANDRDTTKKFIFNAKNLLPEMTVGEAGITQNANIFVVATKGIKGAH